MDEFDTCLSRISGDSELRDALQERFAGNRADRILISRVVRYFSDKENTSGLNDGGGIRAGVKRASPGPGEGSVAKKAKVEGTSDAETWCTLVDVSVLLPARKRMHVKFRPTELVLCPTKPDSTMPDTVVSWSSVSRAICTPTPDKAASKTPSWTVTLLVGRNGSQSDDPKRKPFEFPHTVVFSFDQGSVAVCKGSPDTSVATTPPDSKRAVFDALEQALKSPVFEPEAVPVSARSKQPPKLHIDACLGAKPCFLYLLPIGILVGYKKPILFAPSAQIAEIGLCNVTSRTFDVEIQVTSQSGDGSMKTLELSMIDHSAYENVKDYISTHKKKAAKVASAADKVVDLTESGDEDKATKKAASKEATTAAGAASGHNSEDESEDEDYLPQDESSAEETASDDDESGSSGDSDDSDGSDGSSSDGEEGEAAGDDEDGNAEADSSPRRKTQSEGPSDAAGDEEDVEFETDD